MRTDRGDGIQILQVAGELDLATANDTAARGHAAITGHTWLLLLDLTRLSFCDARGLSALVRIANHAAMDGHGPVQAAIRNALCGGIHLADRGPDHPSPDSSGPEGEDADDAGLQIPLGDAAVPVRGGQPCTGSGFTAYTTSRPWPYSPSPAGFRPCRQGPTALSA